MDHGYVKSVRSAEVEAFIAFQVPLPADLLATAISRRKGKITCVIIACDGVAMVASGFLPREPETIAESHIAGMEILCTTHVATI